MPLTCEAVYPTSSTFVAWRSSGRTLCSRRCPARAAVRVQADVGASDTACSPCTNSGRIAGFLAGSHCGADGRHLGRSGRGGRPGIASPTAPAGLLGRIPPRLEPLSIGRNVPHDAPRSRRLEVHDLLRHVGPAHWWRRRERRPSEFLALAPRVPFKVLRSVPVREWWTLVVVVEAALGLCVRTASVSASGFVPGLPADATHRRSSARARSEAGSVHSLDGQR